MTVSQHILLPDDGGCAFCAYLKGERPYTILFRSELVSTLVTREQRGISHVLVLPVRHTPTILDLTDVEATEVMNEVRHAARLIDRADQRPGIVVWQNNGVAAGQSIGHVHFHVAGTLPEGGTNWGDVHELSVAQTDAIGEKLRRADIY